MGTSGRARCARFTFSERLITLSRTSRSLVRCEHHRIAEVAHAAPPPKKSKRSVSRSLAVYCAATEPGAASEAHWPYRAEAGLGASSELAHGLAAHSDQGPPAERR